MIKKIVIGSFVISLIILLPAASFNGYLPYSIYVFFEQNVLLKALSPVYTIFAPTVFLVSLFIFAIQQVKATTGIQKVMIYAVIIGLFMIFSIFGIIGYFAFTTSRPEEPTTQHFVPLPDVPKN